MVSRDSWATDNPQGDPTDLTTAGWEIPGSEPTSDSGNWLDRFFLLFEAWPQLESMAFDLTLDSEELLREQVVAAADGHIEIDANGPSDDALIRTEITLGLVQDAILPQKAFVMELGLKALLALSGQQTKRWARLGQLHDLLEPLVREMLSAHFDFVKQDWEFPDNVPAAASLESLLNGADDLLAHIKYHAEPADPILITTIFYNLDIALDALAFVIVSHESNAEMNDSFAAIGQLLLNHAEPLTP